MSNRMTVEQAMKSLTGFDEVAIEKSFKGDLSNLNPTMTARALIFALKRRENGNDDKLAFRDAMQMSLGDVDGYFVKPDDEDAEDVEESGKGSKPVTRPGPTS